jgi:membrane fusion protein, multidrug efflux system
VFHPGCVHFVARHFAIRAAIPILRAYTHSLEPSPMNDLTKTRRSNKKRWLWGTALVAILATGAGVAAYKTQAGKAKPDASATAKDDKNDKAAKADDRKYEFSPSDVATLARKDLGQIVPVSGSIRPVNYAVVKSRVGAEVAQVHVQDGERVKRGQVLVTLDAADARARHDSQAAALAEARARLTLAQKNQASNRDLLDRKFISQNAYDSTQSSAEVAAAAVKSAEAQVAIVRRQLEETTIRSPIDGVVAKRWVQVGERIAEQQSVAQVVDLTLMELEALVPISDAPLVAAGSRLDFRVDGFAERTFEGRVERMSPTAEGGTRSIPVYIRIPNTDGALRGGMFASGRLLLGSRKEVSVLPIAALREEGGSFHVFALEAGKLARKPVEVGTRNIDLGYAEIKGGLTDAMPVVAVKMDGLKHGQVASLAGSQTASSKDTPAAKAATSGNKS